MFWRVIGLCWFIWWLVKGDPLQEHRLYLWSVSSTKSQRYSWSCCRSCSTWTKLIFCLLLTLFRRSVLGVHWKDWCWSWNSNTLATSCEELTHWKRPWCWEGLGAGGEGHGRGWDGWMASLTWWTWVWVDSRSWWWTGRPGVLRFMHEVTKSWTRLSDWTELNYPFHWAHSVVDFLPLTCVGKVQLSHCTEMAKTVLDKSLSLSPLVINISLYL